MSSEKIATDLKCALRQLHSDLCPGSHKQHLHDSLTRFQESELCLPVCVLLVESQEEICVMYSLHAIQQNVRHRWPKCTPEQRESVVHTMLHCLSSESCTFPKFVMSKMCQIVAQICRLDVLGYESCSRTNQIVSLVDQLMRKSSHRCIGYSLIGNLLEEFTCVQDSVLLNKTHAETVKQRAVKIAQHFMPCLMVDMSEQRDTLESALQVISCICDKVSPGLILDNQTLLDHLCNIALQARDEQLSLLSVQSLSDLVSQPVRINQQQLHQLFKLGCHSLAKCHTQPSQSYATKCVSYCRALLHKGAPRLKDDRCVGELMTSLTVCMTAVLTPEVYSECVQCWHMVCDRMLVLQSCQSLSDSLGQILNLLHQTLIPNNNSDCKGWDKYFDLPTDAIQMPLPQEDLVEYLDVEDVVEVDTYDNVVQCVVELVAKLALLSPQQVYRLMCDSLSNSIDQLLSQSSPIPPLSMMRCMNSMRVVSRLSFMLTLHNSPVISQIGRNAIAKLCQFVEVYTSTAQDCNQSQQNLLGGGLVSLGGHSAYVKEWYCEAGRSGEGVQDVSSVITCAVDTAACLILSKDERVNRLHCAAESLLRSILLTVRPHDFILQSASLSALVQHFCTQVKNNSLGVCLAAYVCLPWFNAPRELQHWQTRRPLFNQILQAVSNSFLQLIHENSPAKLAELTVESGRVESFLVPFLRLIRDENGECKKQLAPVILPIVQGAVLTLSLHATNVQLCESLLSVVNAAVESLSVQLGSDLCTNALQVIAELPLKDKGVGTVLDMVNTLCMQMSKCMAHLTPHIIHLLLHTLKHTATHANVEVQRKYYALVLGVVLYRWRYLNPPMPSATSQPDPDPNVWTGVPTETDHNAMKVVLEQRATTLCELLFVVVKSLDVNVDMGIVKENVMGIVSVHEKVGVLDKACVHRELGRPLLDSLWSILLSPAHSLVHEDVAELTVLVVTSCAGGRGECGSFLRQYLQESLAKMLDSHTISNVCAEYVVDEISGLSTLVVLNLARDITVTMDIDGLDIDDDRDVVALADDDIMAILEPYIAQREAQLVLAPQQQQQTEPATGG